MALQRISDLDLKQIITGRGAPYFPSPPHWEDEVLYFMLVDRFSDGTGKRISRREWNARYFRQHGFVRGGGFRQRHHE